MTVSDLDRAVAFFTGILDFRQAGEPVELQGSELEHLTGVFGARARLGTVCLELTDFLAPEGRPIPADSRSNDRWFQHVAIVVSDMPRADARLAAPASNRCRRRRRAYPTGNRPPEGSSPSTFAMPTNTMSS